MLDAFFTESGMTPQELGETLSAKYQFNEPGQHAFSDEWKQMGEDLRRGTTGVLGLPALSEPEVERVFLMAQRDTGPVSGI